VRVAFGCDHGGWLLRAEVLDFLTSAGHEITDLGPPDDAASDYPDSAERVARSVTAGEAEVGVLVCGTGIGMSIAANKVAGVRAAVAGDCYSARMARAHNGAQIICLGGRVVGPELARAILAAFVEAEVDADERHARRRHKIAAIETSSYGCS